MNRIQSIDLMRGVIYLTLILCLVVLMAGCKVTDSTQRSLKYSVQVGLNHGGIIENTDLSLISNTQPTPESNVDAYSGATVDAFSGATRTGFNTGVHVNKPLRYGEIETGIDFMVNYQSFTYADHGNNFIGIREFGVHQIMLPLTYNFVLFKQSLPRAEIQFKLGYAGQINLINVSESGILPEYTLNSWSNGGTLGISAYPVMFNNGSKLGFFLDAYRGSRIYTDFYNQKDFDIPASGYMKFGLRYKL
jgi:hypothetical protein